MCGIIGQLAGKRESLERGLRAISHRGPDAQGVYVEDSVMIAQCRLSIIDLSSRADQPMHSASGNITIVFNGEIYNYKMLREELQNSGIHFRTESDTEVLLEGYEKYGIAFLEKLRGMWVFVIYDKRNKNFILSRDRFGIKPLYYSTEEGVLRFSSEIKGLIPLLSKITPNTEMYYQFFNLGYFLPPETHLKEIKKLKPGEIFVWSIEEKKGISQELHYPTATRKIVSFDEALSHLEETLKDSVRAHFVSDVPVGLLLSGGNDSSLLAALAVAIGEKPLLYNLAIEGSNDVFYAKKVAEYIKLPLVSVELTDHMLSEQYERIWEFVDEPTSDPSIIPTSLIFQSIHGKAKVVLSGEGGDEWFGGYVRHKHLFHVNHVIKYNPLVTSFESLVGTSLFSLNYLNPVINRARNIFLDNVTNDLIGSYLKEVKTIDFPINSTKIRNDLYTLYENLSPQTLQPAGLFFDRYSYLPNDLMHKTDATSMNASIEARVPFLDIEILRAVQTIDKKYCLSKEFTNKAILKKIMERYLPSEVIYRPKQGFSFSFSKYNTDSLEKDFEEALVFHKDHGEEFGLDKNTLSLLCQENKKILLDKYPRFAFGLISNWKVWKNKI